MARGTIGLDIARFVQKKLIYYVDVNYTTRSKFSEVSISRG